jgi:hypothetical protein
VRPPIPPTCGRWVRISCCRAALGTTCAKHMIFLTPAASIVAGETVRITSGAGAAGAKQAAAASDRSGTLMSHAPPAITAAAKAKQASISTASPGSPPAATLYIAWAPRPDRRPYDLLELGCGQALNISWSSSDTYNLCLDVQGGAKHAASSSCCKRQHGCRQSYAMLPLPPPAAQCRPPRTQRCWQEAAAQGHQAPRLQLHPCLLCGKRSRCASQEPGCGWLVSSTSTEPAECTCCRRLRPHPSNQDRHQARPQRHLQLQQPQERWLPVLMTQCLARRPQRTALPLTLLSLRHCAAHH